MSLCMYKYMFVSTVVKIGSSISLVIVVLVDEHKGIAMKYQNLIRSLYCQLFHLYSHTVYGAHFS